MSEFGKHSHYAQPSCRHCLLVTLVTCSKASGQGLVDSLSLGDLTLYVALLSHTMAFYFLSPCSNTYLVGGDVWAYLCAHPDCPEWRGVKSFHTELGQAPWSNTLWLPSLTPCVLEEAPMALPLN